MIDVMVRDSVRVNVTIIDMVMSNVNGLRYDYIYAYIYDYNHI